MIFSINLLLPPILFLNYPIFGLPMLLIAFLKPFLILNASFLLLIANYLPFAFVFSFFRFSFFLSLPILLRPFHSSFSPFHSSFFLFPLSLSFLLLPSPFPFILPPSPFSSPFSIRFYVPYPLLPTYISPPISFLLSMHVWMTPYKHYFIFVSLFGKHEKRTNSMYMYIYVCVCWYVWGVGK